MHRTRSKPPGTKTRTASVPLDTGKTWARPEGRCSLDDDSNRALRSPNRWLTKKKAARLHRLARLALFRKTLSRLTFFKRRLHHPLRLLSLRHRTPTSLLVIRPSLHTQAASSSKEGSPRPRSPRTSSTLRAGRAKSRGSDLGGGLTPDARALAALRPVEAMLHDALGEVARKERRSLLGISAIATAVGWTGVLPEKIENLGITFAAPARRALLWVFLAVVLYYTFAFIVYSFSDFLS